MKLMEKTRKSGGSNPSLGTMRLGSPNGRGVRFSKRKQKSICTSQDKP